MCEHAPAVVVSRLPCEASQMGRRGSRKARYFPSGKCAATRRPSLVPAPEIGGRRVRTKSLPPMRGYLVPAELGRVRIARRAHPAVKSSPIPGVLFRDGPMKSYR